MINALRDKFRLKSISAAFMQSKNEWKIISLAFNCSAQTSIGDRHSLVPCVNLMAYHKSDIERFRAIISILYSSFLEKPNQCNASSHPLLFTLSACRAVDRDSRMELPAQIQHWTKTEVRFFEFPLGDKSACRAVADQELCDSDGTAGSSEIHPPDCGH
jgi:hypothetical protein